MAGKETYADLLKERDYLVSEEARTKYADDTRSKYKSSLTDADTPYLSDEEIEKTKEAVELSRINTEKSAIGGKVEGATNDVATSKALGSIVDNLIKFFAVYHGSKTGQDLSKVEVKGALDWDTILKGKVSKLEEERRGLEGQESRIDRTLSRKISEAGNRKDRDEQMQMRLADQARQEQRENVQRKLDEIEREKERTARKKERDDDKAKDTSGRLTSVIRGIDQDTKAADTMIGDILSSPDPELIKKQDKDSSTRVISEAKRSKALSAITVALGRDIDMTLYDADPEYRQAVNSTAASVLRERKKDFKAMRDQMDILVAKRGSLTPEQEKAIEDRRTKELPTITNALAKLDTIEQKRSAKNKQGWWSKVLGNEPEAAPQTKAPPPDLAPEDQKFIENWNNLSEPTKTSIKTLPEYRAKLDTAKRLGLVPK